VNANGATSGTVPDAQAKIHDVALTLASNSVNLTRPGFAFAGCNTAADGSGQNYAPGCDLRPDVGYAADEPAVLPQERDLDGGPLVPQRGGIRDRILQHVEQWRPNRDVLDGIT
jgi:hypothetical protein